MARVQVDGWLVFSSYYHVRCSAPFLHISRRQLFRPVYSQSQMLYPDKDFIVHFLGFSHSNVKPIFCSAVPISGDSFSSFVDQDARMQARLG